MKKYFITVFAVSLTIFSMKAQDTLQYEVENNMPSFYRQMKDRLTFPYAWQNNKHKNFDVWKKEAAAKVIECLSPAPPKAASYDMKVLDTEHRDGYRAEKIEFNLSAFSRVPAYMLIPDGKGSFPAIIIYHDHGAHFSIGKEKMIRPFHVSDEKMKDAEQWAAQCMDSVFVGDELARKGYVVIAVDALFWGDRGRKEGVNYDGQQALSANMLQMGMSWGAFIVWDDVRTAEFLSSLPFIDKNRIGALGFSMGAHRAWMAAAICPEIKAAAAICWMNDTNHLMTLTNNQNKGGSAYSMLIPNLRNYLDYAHVASLACPKPMLFYNGTHDKLFPIEGVNAAYQIMHEVWDSQKASNKLTTQLFDSPHHFGKEMQVGISDFFNQWLK